jgi:hypothetical protein
MTMAMNGFGEVGVGLNGATASSPAVHPAATLENYGPAVHHLGNGAPASEVAHQNGVSNGVMSNFEDEQARLQAEIATANERTTAARLRIAEHDAKGRAALRAELESTRERLVEMERVHRDAVTVVRDSTKAEIDRILAEAQQRAAAIRDGDAGVQRPTISDVE